MKKITIPSVYRIERFGKNIIKHVIAKEFDAEIINTNPLIVKDQFNNEIFIFKKSSKLTSGQKYILTTSSTPDIELLCTENQKLTWFEHPKMQEVFKKDEVLKSWKDSFHFIEESDGLNGLRKPQIAAIYAVLSHNRVSDEIATVVMPTGTGKTETMLSLVVKERYETVLVIVPTDALRKQIARKFENLGILHDFKIVSENAMYPIVGVINTKFQNANEIREFFNSCNVVITTLSLLSTSMKDNYASIATYCSKCFIDEAHHIKAVSWEYFASHFEKSKLIQFTATPFRNDGKRMDGKIIFNYPLKKAQLDGYFSNINFVPIHEYNPVLQNEKLAEKGIELLELDIKSGYDHVLMARCGSVDKAKEVFEVYKLAEHLNPVLIHSSMSDCDKEKSLQAIIKGHSRIVVCVDMLGEGFDLPNLKIAVFHDVRQSLPITLQLAGRFTRTKYDAKLGDASFVANLADMNVRAELDELYSQGSNWNIILAEKSTDQIQSEINFSEFINGFGNNIDEVPIQNLKPAFSVVAYKNTSLGWNITDFRKDLGLRNDDLVYSDINDDEKVIVIISGKKMEVDWGNVKSIQNINWNLTIVYLDIDQKLLFINSSDTSQLYSKLANSISGTEVKIIDKLDVFKAFYGLNRIMLQNVGLKEFLGRNIRFRMSVGHDVEEALSIEEKKRGQKAFVFGTGYEDGFKVSLGCSYKGRIWSRIVGDIPEFILWCKNIGEKIINDKIDGNQILKETLIPEYVSEIPKLQACYIDWADEMYDLLEHRIIFQHGIIKRYLYEVNINLNTDLSNGRVVFELIIDSDIILVFELMIFTNDDISDYKVELLNKEFTGTTVEIYNKKYSIKDYFNQFVPTIWFVDGSSLTGTELIKLSQAMQPYDNELIKVWDWTGVDLSKESQMVNPKIVNSIQYKVISDLKKKDYDIIYDDDGRGEIADIITVKQKEEHFEIELYHLKYSKGGTINTQVANLYEVCGQAQKSVHWKHKSGKLFFDHLLRRKIKSLNGSKCSRIELGSESKLIDLSQLVKKELPVYYKQFIVQPGLSKSKASYEQLTLLSVTDKFLKEFGAMDLVVVGSD